MDETTLKIYNTVIKGWKSLKGDRLETEKYVFGYDVNDNLDKLETYLLCDFDDYHYENIDWAWYEQWLPYADNEIREWYSGWKDYDLKMSQIQTGLLPEDTELNHLNYQGADIPIKQNLLVACQPIKDKIVEMCNNQTLYDPNVN